MKQSGSNLIQVDDDEHVARIIFSPSMVVDGELTFTAFCLVKLASGTPEDYLSVWRTKLKTPAKDNVTFRPRKPEDSLYGYADLHVKKCHEISHEGYSGLVRVKSKDHFHAGIYYTKDGTPVVGECYDPDFMIFASLLVTESRLVVL